MAARRNGRDGVQAANLLAHPNVQAGDERRRVGVRIVQLQPVAPALLRVGEPFVDDELGQFRRLDGLIRLAEGRLGRRPAVGRTGDRPAHRAECHGVDPPVVGIEQRHRVARLAKPKPNAQAFAPAVAAPDAEQPRLAKRGAVGHFKRVAVAVPQRPAGEIDRRLAKVAQLDKVRLGRERRLHVYLVDDDRRRIGSRAGFAGRAGLGRATAPVRRRAGIAQQVDQLKRTAFAVGRAWPSAAVTVVHLDHPPPTEVEQGQPLAVVRQAALVPAVHGQAGVAQLERVGVIV